MNLSEDRKIKLCTRCQHGELKYSRKLSQAKYWNCKEKHNLRKSNHCMGFVPKLGKF